MKYIAECLSNPEKSKAFDTKNECEKYIKSELCFFCQIDIMCGGYYIDNDWIDILDVLSTDCGAHWRIDEVSE